MNPSIKRLLGALLLIGTLGVSSVLAVKSDASVVSHNNVAINTISLYRGAPN